MALLRCLSLPSSIPMHWFALLCCTHLLLCTLFLLGVMLVLCIVHLSHVACALYGSSFPVFCMHCILWFVLYSFPCACPLPSCAWGCIPAWSPNPPGCHAWQSGPPYLALRLAGSCAQPRNFSVSFYVYDLLLDCALLASSAPLAAAPWLWCYLAWRL